MSNRLTKNGVGLLVEDITLLELKVTKGGVQLQSPLPPQEVCKLLQNIAIDLMYNSFVKVEPPLVQKVDSNIQ